MSEFSKVLSIPLTDDEDCLNYRLDHPDEKIEPLMNHISSDTEGASDNSETSRPGVFGYGYRVSSPSFDNKKQRKDTVDRSRRNNNAAFDESVDVDSDMSSIDSPRDTTTITDGARNNPNPPDDCVIDMESHHSGENAFDRQLSAAGRRHREVDEGVAFIPGHLYDEEVPVDGEEEEHQPLCAQSPHERLYGSLSPFSPDDLDRETHRQKGGFTGLPPVELQTFSHAGEKHRVPTCPEFQSEKDVEDCFGKTLPLSSPNAPLGSEDSKSSEESGKQEATKKRRKKRKTKSTSSLDVDGDMDENGNPQMAAPIKSTRLKSASDNNAYSNDVFRRHTDQLRSSTEPDRSDRSCDSGSALRQKREKKQKRQTNDFIKASEIPGHRGDKNLEELLNFIEPNANKKSSSVSNSKKSKTVIGGNGEAKKERKVKSKTPEPRLDHETDSTSSETVSIPERTRRRSDSSSRVKPDSELLDETSKDDFKLVGGKKKHKRSGKEKEDVVRRPIRSKTPPPRSRDSKPQLHISSTPPASGVKDERSLSPSSFPGLPSSRRRNSTGNAQSDHCDISGALMESAVSQAGSTVSYAKIAASPRPKNGLPHQSSNDSAVEVSCVKRNLDGALDDCTKPAEKSDDRKVDSMPPRAASAEPATDKSRDRPMLAEKAREWPSSKHGDNPRFLVDDDRRKQQDRARTISSGTNNSTTSPTSVTSPRDRDVTPPVQSREEFPSLPRSGDHYDKASSRLCGALPTAGNNTNTTSTTNSSSTPLSFANAVSQTNDRAGVGRTTPLSGETTPPGELLTPPAVDHGDDSVFGAMTSKAVIFLDDENFSPVNLGISFEFDASLACEPPPELVAAVQQGEFMPRSESPCGLSFVVELDPKKELGHPINGLVPIRPMDQCVRPKVKEWREETLPRRYRDDDCRINIADAVKFLHREWLRIQEYKAKGTMRVIEYQAN